MDAATTSSAYVASSSEATAPATFDDDARHYAITASQVPKPAAASMPPPLPVPNPPPEPVKDIKNVGTRFHEDCHETDSPSPRLRSSRVWKGKGKETLTVEREAQKPKGLLDLPLDILKDIVREVTHTNDLTSLALCHSALHRLAVPHIYSRFDIVWPDSSTHAEPRSGVDALTYGLATLVMAEEVFGEAPGQRTEKPSNRFAAAGHGKASDMTIRRRRGNHYAHFTKKFSLGNGPADWVQEYLISKEGGKMLGTLVALAVARMRSLETFVWDMPTGVLRDVWLALSSLAERADGEPCRLEKVWVRWHDNSSADHPHAMPPPYVTAPPPLHAAMGNFNNPGLPAHIRLADLDRVEHPSFSVLPPMKSLSVLDIDELAYLDEMAVLIGRSVEKLQELRIGLARHAMTRDWVTVWEGDNLQQVDRDNPTAGSLTIGEKRLGGVLGTLMGFVHDMRPRRVLPIRPRRHSPPHPELRIESPPRNSKSSTLNPAEILDGPPTPKSQISPPPLLSPRLSPPEAGPAFDSDPLIASSRCASPQPQLSDALPGASEAFSPVAAIQPDVVPELEEPPDDHLQSSLRLKVLEMERVPLSIPVLQRAIDWSVLTSLTILHCQNHEALWKTLKRTFCPTPKSPVYPTPRRNTNNSPRKHGKQSLSSAGVELQYHLNLKRIHTNTVSPSLISFLKETLAPNSLEVLFLQEGRAYTSTVTVDAIYRGPLRRHRQSLQKVLIDSSEKGPEGHPTSSSRWRRWMLTRDILTFICSGKMSNLRELGMALDYHDWHFFLQNLPSIPHLRSLYIPFLADHVHGSNTDPRELALQGVDVVALRPEVELCYIGIGTKCFEILESRREWDSRTDSNAAHPNLPPIHGGNGGVVSSEGEEDDADDMEDEDEDELDGESDADDNDDTESDADHDDDDDDDDDDEFDDDDLTDSDEESDGPRGKGKHARAAKLRLREILFYDDKVAVFKARHGKL